MSRKKKTLDELLEEALVLEVEQPYEIPKNWAWTKFGGVASLKNGYAFKSTDFTVEGIPVIRISDIKNNLATTNNSVKVRLDIYNEAYKIENGDLLIAMSGATTGKTGVYDSEEAALQNQRVGNIKEHNPKLLNREFKNYFVIYSSHKILEKAYGGAQPNVSGAIIENLDFPLPPLEEQKRIARKIEILFSKIDEAKRLIEEARETVELRRAAVLEKAFQGKLTEKWREQNSIKMESWKVTELQEQTSLLGDGLHGTPKYTSDGEYYFINGNNFDGVSISLKPNTKRVSVEEYEKYKKNLTNQTVFISINGTLGKTAFYNGEPIVLGKSACYFNVRETLDKYFIRYYLETREFLNYADKMATGSTIKNLSLKAMRKLPLHLPSLEEQKEIVHVLNSLFKIEHDAKIIHEVSDETDRIKQSILSKAFRGELGTNIPTEESAIELLKSVLQEKIS